MIIMKSEATKEEIANVVKEIKKFGLKADVSQGEFRTVIGLIGDTYGPSSRSCPPWRRLSSTYPLD